jgi:hypothetical protein
VVCKFILQQIDRHDIAGEKLSDLIPVLMTGTAPNGGVFNGVFKVTSVAANSVTGALTATGNLSGTITDSAC